MCVVSLLGACGSSSKSTEPTQEVAVDPASATASVSSLHDVRTAMANNDPTEVADDLMSLTTAGETVIAPTGTMPRLVVPRIAAHAPLTGSASCTPTSCTFTDYGDSEPDGSYTLNGTITTTGDTLSVDLTLDVTTSETSFEWSLDGAITFTDTTIDGTLDSHGSATSSGSDAFDITWDIDVDYQSIVFDDSGCPIDGAISVTETFASGAESYSAEGGASFGPACGDVSSTYTGG
jgi:hypothetical protein